LGQTETQWLVPESGGSKDVHDLATTVAIRDAVGGFGIRDAQDEPWPADDFFGRGLKLIVLVGAKQSSYLIKVLSIHRTRYGFYRDSLMNSGLMEERFL
jgi:hypothetical protein